MTESSSAAERPNVIVFFADQQRWDTLGAHGNPMGLTPNLDLMAAYGTDFDCAFTTNPVCAPARAAVQTGRYPTTVGVHRNGLALPAQAPTMGSVFGSAGYTTGYIGKWHLANREPVPAELRGGYEHWLASDILEFTSDEYRTVVFDEECSPVELPGYRADALTDAAIRFVADHHRDPFFLFLSFVEPHHQNERDNYPAPEGYAQRYDGGWLPPDLAALGGSAHRHIGGYYGQIKRLDECLGRLRDALRSLDLTQRTIVVYAADHGSHFKTRNSEYKRSCHDASVRVPLVCFGGPFTSGGRHRELVSTVDIAPTLFEAAGIQAGDSLQGRSFLPLVTRKRAETGRPHVLIQVSESETGRALRTDRWKYYVARDCEGDPPAAGSYLESALYDVDADPYELHNLIDDANYESVIETLRRSLLDEIFEIEGSRPQILAATRHETLRKPDPTIRGSGLRPTRFGHQSKITDRREQPSVE